jgi:tetratricopeptide (TPR) repeat protein
MNRILAASASIFLLGITLCSPSPFGQTVRPQQQDAANPPLPSAKQIADDEEKNLLAAVQTAESGDASPKELTSKLEALARYYQSQNRRGDLSPILDRELAAAKKAWPNNDPGIVKTLRQIAVGFQLCNERDRAELIDRRIIDIDTKRFGLMNRDVSADLVSLGRTTSFKPDTTEAESHYMQALPIDQLLNDDQATAEVIQALAGLARIQNNPEKADALLAREIEALKLNTGRNDQKISTMLMQRANQASIRGDYVSAAGFAELSMEIEKRITGETSPDVRGRLGIIADYYRHLGNFDTAALYLQQALQMAEADKNDAQHLSEIGPLLGLARIYQQEKKYPDAEATLMRLLELENKAWDQEDSSFANTTFQLANLYAEESKNLEAEVQYRRTIALADGGHGSINHLLPQYLGQYAHFLKKLNRNEEADKVLKRAIDIQAARRAAVQNQTSQI